MSELSSMRSCALSQDLHASFTQFGIHLKPEILHDLPSILSLQLKNKSNLRVQLLVLELYLEGLYVESYFQLCSCLFSEHPTNQWLYLRVLELSLKAQLQAHALSIFSDYVPSQPLVDASRFYQALSRLCLSFHTIDHRIEWLQSLPQNSFVSDLITLKLCQAYLQANRRANAIHQLARIHDWTSLPESGFLSLSLLVPLLPPHERRQYAHIALQRFSIKSRFEYLHLYFLHNAQIPPITDVSSLFKHADDSLLLKWQFLLWFNRYQLDSDVDHDVYGRLLSLYLARSIDDTRWLFQFAVAAIRFHQFLTADCILSRVSLQHPTLSALSMTLRQSLANLHACYDSFSVSDRTEPFRCSFISNNSPVCVFFSGWYGSFSYFDHDLVSAYLARYSINTISLRDPTLAWFTNGIDGLGRCPESAASAINLLCRSSTSGPIIFIGSSITGYSALNYSSYVAPDILLSFSGSLPLEGDCDFLPSDSASNDLWSMRQSGHKDLMRRFHLKSLCADIEPMFMRLAALGTSLYYIYGADNEVDRRTADYMSMRLSTKLVPIDGVSTHSISNYCMASSLFLDILSDALASLPAEE